MGQHPDSSSGVCTVIWYISRSSSTGAGAPTQVEDGNFRLSISTWTPDWLEPKGCCLRFLGHHPVTSPPINQKKATHPAALPQNLPLKILPSNPSESLGFFLSMSCSCSLLGPCNKPFSAPNSDISVCLASLCIGHTKLGSTTFSVTIVSNFSSVPFSLSSPPGIPTIYMLHLL